MCEIRLEVYTKDVIYISNTNSQYLRIISAVIDLLEGACSSLVAGAVWRKCFAPKGS